MSKTIEIMLSDAQWDTISKEADAAGVKFFAHCRNKLMATVTTPPPLEVYGRSPAMQALPKLKRENERVKAEVLQPDRIDRLEALVLGLAETVNNALAQPQAYEPEPYQPEADVDIDDIVNASLGEAERQGLTALDREPAVHGAGGVRHVGSRPPSPFSPATQPRHLNGLG